MLRRALPRLSSFLLRHSSFAPCRFVQKYPVISCERSDPILTEMEEYSSQLNLVVQESLDQMADSHSLHYARPRHVPETKNPSDSLIERVLPLSTDLAVRRTFIQPTALLNSSAGPFFNVNDPTHALCIGSLLETIECVATRVAYEHCDGLSDPVAVLCAWTNRIERLGSLSPHSDICFTGRCVATGKSTMKILVDVFQEETEISTSCLFTMVAREIDVEHSALVNPLLPTTTDEWAHHELSQDSSAEIHQMMLDLVDIVRIRDLTSSTTSSDSTYQLRRDSLTDIMGREMKHGRLRSLETMSPTSRNIFGKVYGGVLLKEAFFLAHANATMYSGNRNLQFVSMDDTAFLKPVFIGSIVSYTSHVVYAESDALQVRVDLEVLNPKNNTTDITSAVHLTFYTPNLNKKKNEEIFPRTQEEALMYMQGKMIHLRKQNQQQLDELRERQEERKVKEKGGNLNK